jgi:hypothetical protein
MTWAKLLANNNVTRQPAAKKELDNLRSIVSRSLKDVTAPGLSADARFIMAYDAARTLSLMIVRSFRLSAKSGRRTLQHLSCARNSGRAVRQALQLILMVAVSSAMLPNMILRVE